MRTSASIGMNKKYPLDLSGPVEMVSHLILASLILILHLVASKMKPSLERL